MNARRLLVLAPVAVTVLLGLGGRSAAAQGATCEGPGVAARVQEQSSDAGETTRDPVPGVEFVVTTPDGAEVGRAETDDTGVALICVPERADYVVTLQEESLPDGVEINGATEITLDESSFATNIRRLNFFSGDSGRESLSFFEKLAQRFVDGSRLGLIIAITSVGLSLIFGTTGL